MTVKLPALLAAIGFSLVLTACGNDTPNPDTTGEGEVTNSSGSLAGADTDGGSLATGEMYLGAEDAPVTLLEYASVTCPACAAFHINAYDRLKEHYIETGKVKLVFREFPTSPAQLSYLGSALARCTAEEKGPSAYFGMLSTLFVNQRDWVNPSDFQSKILSYAAQAGLTEEQFRACLGRDEIIDKINENVETGRTEDNVTGTPTFILQGEKLDGYRTYDDIFAMIDEALVEAGVEPPVMEDDTEETAEEEVVEQTPGTETAQSTESEEEPVEGPVEGEQVKGDE